MRHYCKHLKYKTRKETSLTFYKVLAIQTFEFTNDTRTVERQRDRERERERERDRETEIRIQ